MTKERKLAIQMWEEIAQQQPDNINRYKTDFCSSTTWIGRLNAGFASMYDKITGRTYQVVKTSL